MADFPIVITTAGLQPQAPATLRAEIVAKVSATNPGITTDLPGTLIEDVVSTDVASLSITDSAKVETVNSLTPYGANAFLLNQLGQVFGVPLGQASNTSVFVIFTGTPGFVIAKGFVVSDGSYQYVLQTGGVIGSDGQSPQLYALADSAGTWAVPAGTVTQLVTQPPSPFTLAVVNPEAGVPGTGAESEASYRARVLQAQLAASQGMAALLRTFLGNVSGVQPRLIGIQQQEAGGWLIIVGGGDPYEIGYAIATALFDVSTLVGSTLTVAGITSANPGVVSTFLNHGYSAGQAIAIADVSPGTFDGSFAVLEVITEKTFKLGKAYLAAALTGLSWASTGGGQATATFGAAHGVTVGSTFTVTGSAPSGYNGTFVAIAGTSGSTLVWALVSNPGSATVLGSLSAGIAFFNTTSLTWVSGGVLTPNLRNIGVTVLDYPDTYLIRYVNPPQQVVTMTVTWNTSSPNFVAPAAVAQLAAPALSDYINTIYVGQPINLLQMRSVFQAAVYAVLPPDLLTRLVFSVSINGVGTAPDTGTDIIEGDPESYLYAVPTGINVVQG